MKKALILFVTILLLVCLTGCQCEHNWADATCDTPKTCTECGETEGLAADHYWFYATCTEPETCKNCGMTQGEPIAHEWVDADCENAKHCGLCGETEGDALGHYVSDEWIVAKKAEPDKNGKKVKLCTVCEKEIESETIVYEPVFYWNKPVDKGDFTLGFYENDDKYYFEMTSNDSSSSYMLFLLRESTDEDTKDLSRMVERMDWISNNYDDSYKKGDCFYYTTEGYGIEWTLYFTNPDKEGKCKLGVRSNVKKEIAACYDGLIGEENAES